MSVTGQVSLSLSPAHGPYPVAHGGLNHGLTCAGDSDRDSDSDTWSRRPQTFHTL